MKRIVKFIIRKVVELAGAFVVWWGLSWYGYWVDSIIGPSRALSDGTMLEKWLEAPFLGFMLGIIFPAIAFGAIVLICFGLYHWIKWNWEKAGE